jgi:NDP-sugar pyrophosphorylase family protein
MEGFVCVGKGSRIEHDVSLKDTVIWDDVVIEKGSRMEGCIVADNARVTGEHREEALIPG